MHLGGRILAALAVMFPPIQADNLHTAIRAGSRGIIFKQCAQSLLEAVGVLLSEAGLFGQLAVDAAKGGVETEVYTVLHTHSIAGLFVAGYTVYAFGNLDAACLNGVNAERWMNGYRAAHAHGYAVALGVLAAECEYLTKAAYIQPLRTSCLCIDVPILTGFFHLRAAVRAVLQALEAVIAAVIRLNKDILP